MEPNGGGKGGRASTRDYMEGEGHVDCGLRARILIWGARGRENGEAS